MVRMPVSSFGHVNRFKFYPDPWTLSDTGLLTLTLTY